MNKRVSNSYLPPFLMEINYFKKAKNYTPITISAGAVVELLERFDYGAKGRRKSQVVRLGLDCPTILLRIHKWT